MGWFADGKPGQCGFHFQSHLGIAMKMMLAVLLLTVLAATTHAANYPCSGRKGGVAHCAGERFVCNDGSISASKRNCQAELGDGAPRMLLSPAPTNRLSAGSDGGCSCRQGRVCTGPRGGQYCISDSGNKSYVRK
ncbi:MAG: hypothetical protein ACN6O3_20990 [Comamonas sp.]